MLQSSDGAVVPVSDMQPGNVGLALAANHLWWSLFVKQERGLRMLPLSGRFAFALVSLPDHTSFFRPNAPIWRFTPDRARDFTQEEALPGDFLVHHDGRMGVCGQAEEEGAPHYFVGFDGSVEALQNSTVTAFPEWRLVIGRDREVVELYKRQESREVGFGSGRGRS